MNAHDLHESNHRSQSGGIDEDGHACNLYLGIYPAKTSCTPLKFCHQQAKGVLFEKALLPLVVVEHDQIYLDFHLSL